MVRDACSRERTVVSTGGGAFVQPENRQLMLSRGLVVLLEASPETIYQRLQSHDAGAQGDVVRPLLASPDPLERIRQLKRERQPVYALAHWTVHTDQLTPGQVAQEVVRAWGLLRGKLGQGQAQDPYLAAQVTHSGGSYPVLVGWGLLEQLGDRLKELDIQGPVYIITDTNLLPLWCRTAQRSLQASGVVAHVYAIPPGEPSKTLDMAGHIYQWLTEHRAERGHAIIGLGGGVVGDLAGFVAATFLRGVPFVQVPTSLAAMVDASIGGKVAVDLPQGKNLVGAFYQPRLVLADVQCLTTQSRRGLAEGWAEAIKHGLILDAGLFETFEQHAEELLALEPEITTQVIRRSMAIKAQVVTEDERETLGRRILLNYGHTIGHALEAATGYGQYLHGEAVSVGMMGAARISQRMGLLEESVVERQRRVLERMGLPLACPGVDRQALLAAMALDKKTAGRAIRWVLLEGLGRAMVRRDVPQELVLETLEVLTR